MKRFFYFSAALFLLQLGLYPIIFGQENSATKITPQQTALAEKHYQLGLSYEKQGWVKSSRREWEVALKLNPNHKAAKEKLEAYPQRSITDQPQSLFDKLETSFRDGMNYYKTSRLDEAMKEWQGILAVNTSFAKAKQALDGLDEEIYHQDHNLPFDKLVEAKYEEAMRLYRQENFKEALERLEQAAEMSPAQPQVVLFLGRCQQKLKESESRENLDGHRQKALEAQTKKQWDKAMVEWDEVLKLAPKLEEALKAKQNMSEKLHEEKIEAFSNILKQAEKAEQAGGWAEAKKLYENCLAIDSQNPVALKGISLASQNLDRENTELEKQNLLKQADLALESKQFKKADRFYECVLKLDPKDESARQGLEKAVLGLQNKSGDGKEQIGHFAKGIKFFESGTLDDALREFNSVPEDDKDYEDAQNSIKLIKEKKSNKIN